jgi:hypothetical protein
MLPLTVVRSAGSLFFEELGAGASETKGKKIVMD